MVRDRHCKHAELLLMTNIGREIVSELANIGTLFLLHCKSLKVFLHVYDTFYGAIRYHIL